MNDMKKHGLSLAGVLIMAISVIWSFFPSDSTVPNDANIGAGVLFMFGVVVVIAGLAMAWARRSSATPPPPSGHLN